MLNSKEQEKYSRQTIMWGEKQHLLKNSKVIIVGVGALGSNAAELLTRAGVGNIVLIDDDVIEESNLQRQSLFAESDVGKSKVIVAKRNLEKINSLITITKINSALTEKNTSILQADLILDCTDNMETRFLINNFSKKNSIPWIFASCAKTEGYVMPIQPQGPCLECFLHDKQGDSLCASGVINTIVHGIAALQVTFALKLLQKEKVTPRLYYLNLWVPQLRTINIKKSCQSCLNDDRDLATSKSE